MGLAVLSCDLSQAKRGGLTMSLATEYTQRVESALGDAYSEPAADVRGYLAQVQGQAVAS
jgi:hypothetical protein